MRPLPGLPASGLRRLPGRTAARNRPETVDCRDRRLGPAETSAAAAKFRAEKAQTDSEEDGESEENFARWRDRLKTGGNWTADYVDVREDPVLLYGTVGTGMAEYRYHAKATAGGVFNVPPVYAEAMYVPTLRAHSGAGTVRVDQNDR